MIALLPFTSGVWILALVVALIGVGELADWLGRRNQPPAGRQRPSEHPDDARGAVVVLGFPGDDRVRRSVQRWRVAMAMRAAERYGCTRVVFTGGTPHSSVSEASQMAAHARERGLADARIVLEERSASTWENVHLAQPLVDGADPIVIVSDGLHARRARNYWLEQFPDVHSTVMVDDAYRLLDHFWWKTPSALVELARLARRARLRARA